MNSILCLPFFVCSESFAFLAAKILSNWWKTNSYWIELGNFSELILVSTNIFGQPLAGSFWFRNSLYKNTESVYVCGGGEGETSPRLCFSFFSPVWVTCFTFSKRMSKPVSGKIYWGIQVTTADKIHISKQIN